MIFSGVSEQICLFDSITLRTRSLVNVHSYSKLTSLFIVSIWNSIDYS
jgi:hypothetical protein